MSYSLGFKINSPNDDDLVLDSSCLANIKPDTQLDSPTEHKKKKRQKNNNQMQMTATKKKQNYFQRMYHEAEVKTYVNVFIRKLKQIIVRSQDFRHHLCQDGWGTHNYNQLKTFNLSPKVEIIFNLFCIFVTLFSCIYSTLVLVFAQFSQFPYYQTCSIVSFLFFTTQFILNIFSRSSINFHNPKSSNFQFVNQAINEYFTSGWLIVDSLLILFFFCDIFFSIQFIQYFRLLVLVKIYQMVFKVRNLQILFIRNCFKQQFWELMKIFAFNFIFAHFIAIVLLLIADPQKMSWMKQKGINDAVWSEKYIWAYYWATTIMLTVGFGDLTATNVQQATTLIFIQTISCMVLAYNIANVSKIIDKITSYEMEKMQNLKIFTQMQSKQPISSEISKKITNYIIESAELKRNFNVNEENSLVNKLPKTFHEQLRKQSTNRLFGTIPFFRNLKFSKLQELAIRIDKKLTHPEEIIVEAGSIPQVHILNKGHISYNMHRVGLKSHGKEIQQYKINSDEYRIASMYFFIRKSVKYDIKCKDYTILYSIPQKQLQHCLSTNPYSFEYYCMHKDKDRFNACDWQIEKCDLCPNVRHTYFQCPKLHFVPIKNMIIAKALFNGQVRFKISKAGRRRRMARQTISAIKFYSEIESMFKKIQIMEKAKEVFRESRKLKGEVKWGKIQQNYYQKEAQEQQHEQDKKQNRLFPNKRQPSLKKSIAIKQNNKNKDQIIENENFNEQLFQYEQTNENESIRQIETMMKIQYLKSFKKVSTNVNWKVEQKNNNNNNRENKKRRISVQDVCKHLTDRLKDQWAKSPFFNTNYQNDFHWIVNLDVVHDYGFYFQNDNAANLRKKWKKRKHVHLPDKMIKNS